MYLNRYVFPAITLALSVVIAQDTPTMESSDLKRTLITPILETEIKPDQNLIYCATFQLAWNEYRDSFPGYLPEDPEIIKQLDKKMFVKDYLSEDCYVAMSGRWKNIAEKINRILKEKFGDEAWLLTKERVLENRFSENTPMAYAFLFKNLVFPEMFESLDEPIWFESQRGFVKVGGFGVREFMPDEEKHKNLGKQVSIYYYKYDYKKSPVEFVIELKPESSNEEIIIAQVTPGKTLLEAIRNIQEIITENKPTSLRGHETLQIPEFDFDIEHYFTEIEKYLSRLVSGPAKAYQRTKFKLDEKGAILKSEAIITAEALRIMPRQFIVSKPFLIYLKQKDSPYPYFAMWVENGEILKKFH
jgi:hypothetical protein